MIDPAKAHDSKEEYVSPTSDESLRQRYERIQPEEAEMTGSEVEEKITRLEQKSDFFDWQGNE